MKRLIAFDLDGTLADSKQPLQPDMAALLARMLDVAMVAVISGGDWPQFETQLVERLPQGARLDRLFVMPTTGAKLYRFIDGRWAQVYAETFSAEDRDRIIAAVTQAVADAGLVPEHVWGEQIEDRGSQITFSALGQQAPLAEKQAWDPDVAKRKALQQKLLVALPDVSVRIGGSTSIDITGKGVDKAYAIQRLVEHSGVAREAILFLGDAIYPGGNDDPVRAARIDTVAVRDPAETASILVALTAWLQAGLE
ncbi:HAD-IIB family hydrolase [Sphingomonas sp. HF-S3]|uniref:phosphomannomutase n=1 Tax=Sphingomonas rustica TaxID=3103142 RepID=A0ABV0B787_9SPHN